MTKRPYVWRNDLATLNECILGCLIDHGSMDLVELVTALAVSPRQIQKAVEVLISEGKVAREIDSDGFRVYRVAG